ncbi:hypothetical protein [Priestia taiwanensis]|uniref:Uncharacterized protein n=1 Tax=Priestia taiwanensis TaxID=1347902 RepID=A0A917EP15_9BACI|nr:hypothetical protein [Priestia taiwanensis]MBM7363306.1 membrane-associated HD superfamily phosphohydrolase [Priestia taiwanensis]GGE69335.1 hypothetical protein GCM10007140_19240 [Priestia taiwanensis]
MALLRKAVATSLAACIFFVLVSFIWPNTYGAENLTFQKHISYAIASVHTLMVFAFPIVAVYCFITSIISDEIGKLIATKTGKQKAEIFVSGALHIVFGLIFYGAILGAMILLVMTELLLKKRQKEPGKLLIIFSFSLPFMLYLSQGLNNYF